MRGSPPIRLIGALALGASGLSLLAIAAWMTFAADTLGGLLDMVDPKYLNWGSAAEVASMAAAGLLLIYVGLKWLATRPTA